MIRFRILVLFYFFILVFVFSSIQTTAFSTPLLGKVIFVDPGHGGRDPGTIYGNVLEKDINLEISKALEKELTRLGALVYMTREKDEDLSSIYDTKKKRGDLYRRILMISNKKYNTDLYLSIHINWYDNSYWKGAEVLYHSINHKNKILASNILNELKNETGTKRSIKKTDLYLYKNIRIPGVLIECGFLSNPSERSLLQDKSYQKKIALAISKGVINYFQED